MQIHVNVHFCLNLHRDMQLRNIKVTSGNLISNLVLKRSADLDNKLAVIIHGYVYFCINMPREDILYKRICWQSEFHIQNTM